MVRPRHHRRTGLFAAWLAAVFVYLLIVQKGNLAHEYYQLPVVLPFCFYLGRGVTWLLAPDRRRRRLVRGVTAFLLLGALVLGTVRYVDYLRREDLERSAQVAMARLIVEHTDTGDLGVFAYGGDPTVMYLAHRKGWVDGARRLDSAFLDRTIAEGARFLAAPAAALPDGLLDGRHVVTIDQGAQVLVLLEP
jgi:hypothetical protein